MAAVALQNAPRKEPERPSSKVANAIQPCATLSSGFSVDRDARRGLVPGPGLTDTERSQLPTWSETLLSRGSEVVDELPAFPGTASKLLELLELADPEPSALIEIIRTDPAISAQVLKLANSAALGRGVEITTVQMATTRLGLKTVASVALAASTRALLDEQERMLRQSFRARWRAFSEASLRVANASRWLSKSLHRGAPEEAYLAGLMLDLGMAVALRVAGGMTQRGELPANLSAAALEALLHRTHLPLGVDLSTVWDLPGYITHVLANHHQPRPDAAPVNDVLHVVRVTSALDALRTNPFAAEELPIEMAWSAVALGVEPQPLATLADCLADPSMQE